MLRAITVMVNWVRSPVIPRKVSSSNTANTVVAEVTDHQMTVPSLVVLCEVELHTTIQLGFLRWDPTEGAHVEPDVYMCIAAA